MYKIIIYNMNNFIYKIIIYNNLITYYDNIIKYIYLLDIELIKKICNKLNIYVVFI